MPDIADLAGSDQLDGLPEQRVGPVPDRLHQEAAAFAGEVDQRFGLGGGDGERLLDQHGLAGAQAGPGGGEWSLWTDAT